MITEGGFPAGTAEQLGIRNFTVPGTSVDFPGGLAPFAAPLLLWVAGEIHRRVEKLHDGWCWGWNFRAVIGATVLSDHAGGVAIDINAPAHPRGVRGTWSSAEVSTIRDILREANRDGTVIVWGHDFRTTVDDMHFACRGTKAQVIAAGERLSAPREWDEMATRAEVREVMDNALAAALTADNAALQNAIRVAIEAERAEGAAAVWTSPLLNPVTGETQAAGTFLRFATQRLDVLRKWAESIAKAVKATPPV